MSNEPMGMMLWMATEGGRKCPQCGKYAKSAELGNIGFNTGSIIVSVYGHLPGFGCNKLASSPASAGRK